ncbi:MAG: hypothetical protein CFE44_19880, partial [Burkholderiales bacterium PBB4]
MHSKPRLQPTSSLPDPGFEIGWDFAHHRLVPPAEQLLQGNPVRDGWQAGQSAFGSRTLRATPQVRKWLQLRLGAWMRGKSFDLEGVTPNFLEQIESEVCPIMGLTLTRGTGTLTDASVDRVNNQAGYAAGNLAVMSVRANRAKAAYDWRDAAEFVRQIERGQLGEIDGLTARQWARLAALMSFCTPLSHSEAANLPLLVLPPPRLQLLNPVQVVQATLTACFARTGKAPKVDSLVRHFPAPVQCEVRALLTTLLARKISAGPSATAIQLRSALETAWCAPAVLRRWRCVALQMNATVCETVVANLSGAAGSMAPMGCLGFAQATKGWALGSKGAALLPPRSGQESARGVTRIDRSAEIRMMDL